MELPTLEEVAVGEGRFSRLVGKTKGAKRMIYIYFYIQYDIWSACIYYIFEY